MERTMVAGTELRALREQRRLTQAQLADRSGVSQRSIRAIENGQSKRPHAATIRSIAFGLELSRDELAQLSGQGVSPSVTALAEMLRTSPELLQGQLRGIHSTAALGGSWTSQFHHNQVHIGRDGHFELTRTQRMITSTVPELTHVLRVCNYSDGPRHGVPEMHDMYGCSLSGQWVLPQHNVVVYELKFDRTLRRGDSITYGYSTDERLPTEIRRTSRLPDRVVSGTRSTIDLLRMELRFRGRVPRVIRPFWVSGNRRTPVLSDPVSPTPSGSFCVEQQRMAPGRAHGFIWTW
ncbi:helix-turn-helix domain-containing protein [Naumannella halotolerans]|uniref:helix-turn-helix domain-containing protein n=1 Tax=Naumannella halotolerans TaxID=993414 RepID=UPI00370D181B